jgi:hypothetical protein
VVSPEIFDKSGESFIEPQIIPPSHGYQISKPLQGIVLSHY